jgi:transketolase
MDLQKVEAFRDEIRLKTLKELYHLGFGHYGGSLSIVEALAVLYGEVMKVNPRDPRNGRIVITSFYQKVMVGQDFMRR